MVTSLKQDPSSRLQIPALLGVLALPLWYWLSWVNGLSDEMQPLPYLTIHSLLWMVLLQLLFWMGDRHLNRAQWMLLLGFSLLFHLLAAHSAPVLETDPWRYLWDGKQLLHGINPYLTAPSDSLAFDTTPEWFEKINHPHLATIYPPLAQLSFWISALLSEGSLTAWKLICIVLSFATFAVLASGLKAMGKNPSLILLLAWNPLWIKEFANSAHMDLVMLLPLAAAARALVLGQQKITMVLMGLATLGKLSCLAILPTFWSTLKNKKDLGLIPLIVLMAYLPFMLGERWTAPFEVLGVFGKDWIFHAFIHDMIVKSTQALGGSWELGMSLGRILAAVILLLVSFYWMNAKAGASRALQNSFWMMTLFLLLSQVIFPWYVSWALMLSLFATSQRSALVWTLLAPISYTYYIDWQAIYWLKYLSFAILLYYLWQDWQKEKSR